MLTDYCILNPFGSGYVDPPTEAPTAIITPPTSVPTSRPSIPAQDGEPSASPSYFPRPVGPPKEVWNRGWEPAFKLGECEGDCDEDTDCMPGLICFQREAARVAVPGCTGGEEDESLTDYCAYPELPEDVDVEDIPDVEDGRTETSPPTTPPPTKEPTLAPTPSDSAIPLNPVGWSPPADKKPLGLCEGDCDDDSDCGDGLVCFQRFLPLTAVPGCSGGTSDTSLMDFCIRDPIAPTNPPTAAATTASPTAGAVSATGAPALDVPTSAAPTAVGDVGTDVVVGTSDPPPIDCQSYRDRGVNVNRICKEDPFMCCRTPRSDSNYCHEIYTVFGDQMESACHHCCIEERGEALDVGPANDPHPQGLAPYDACDKLSNTGRLCKAQGCCDVGFADTEYCRNEWAQHPGEVERICWSCCFPSKVFPEPTRRQLLGNATFTIGERDVISLPNTPEELLETLEEKVDYETSDVEDEDRQPIHTAMTEEEMRLYHKNNPPELRPGDKFFEHPSMNRKLIVREENFTPKDQKDEDAYFEEIHSAFQHRELQIPLAENYDDVYWWPYEWLLKVGTEYYFRYEGSMTVPPCYTVNHWRVMKDPIRVAKHQIQELERLLAWRLDGNCDASTAGKPRDGNPDAVDVNRPLQELERGHRMVFCECQDWPSKFPNEREWCKKWQTRDPELRLFDNPYNWAQNGF